MTLSLDSNHLVLKTTTRQTLITRDWINLNPNPEGFDIFKADIKFPIPFPDEPFDKVPYRFDSLAFLTYLGLKQEKALQIFADAKTANPVLDGEILLSQITVAFEPVSRLDGMLKKRFDGGAISDFANTNTYLAMAGFTDDFAADVKHVIDEAKEDLSSLDKYMGVEAPFRSLNEFDFTEYVLATLHRKFDNLTEFDNAVQKYLAENPA